MILHRLAESKINFHTLVQDLKTYDVDENVLLLITFVPEFKFRFLFVDQALKSEKERALAIAILKFPDALDSLVQVSPPAMRHFRALNLKVCVLQELLPSRLCDYAYYLCVAFNEFYSSCKVGISKDPSRRRKVRKHRELAAGDRQ